MHGGGAALVLLQAARADEAGGQDGHPRHAGQLGAGGPRCRAEGKHLGRGRDRGHGPGGQLDQVLSPIVPCLCHTQYSRCADENEPLNVDIVNYLLMTSNVLYMKGKQNAFKFWPNSFPSTGMITDPWNLPNIRSHIIRQLNKY